MFEDLRGFLTHLESHKQLLRVKDAVDVKYEIAAGMRKTSDIEGPALLFENVKGYPGWRVLGGLFATRKLVALGLGVPQEQMLERYLTLEDERALQRNQMDRRSDRFIEAAHRHTCGQRCWSVRHHRCASRQRSGHRHPQLVDSPNAGSRQR